MFITGFKVKDCLYITNKEIRSIESTMTEQMQLILGTNGSGKSVLTRLLTGWPPKPKAFKAGGYFELTARNETDTYLIRYDFAKSVKCTFIKNDDVLNDKSTTTVQKDLLKEHFGIDQDIYKLMTGLTSFTDMSANERKRWIDKVSPIDMTYITGVYDRVRKTARDVKGAIKVNTERMHREQTRLDTLGLPENIDTEYDALNGRFIALTREHAADHPTSDTVVSTITRINEEMQADLSRLIDLQRQASKIGKDHNITTFGQLDEHLTYLRLDDNRLIAESEAIMADVSELDKVLHTFKGPLGNDLDELNESLTDFKEAIEGVKSNYPNGLPFNVSYDDSHLANSMNEFIDLVRKLATDIPSNSKPTWYSREECNRLRERRLDLRTAIQNKKTRLSRLADKLREMENSRLIDCPKCEHSFHQGFTIEDKVELERVMNKDASEQAVLEEEYERVTEMCEEIDIYHDAGKIYNTAKSISTQHAGFWASVEEAGYLGSNPSRLNDDVVKYNEVVGDIRSIYITAIEIKRIEQVITNMANLGGNDAGSIQAKRDALLAKREGLLAKIEDNRKVSAVLDSFRRLAFEQKQLVEGMSAKTERMEEAYLKLSNAAHHDIIREELDQVVGRLGIIRESVNKKQVLSNVIDGIKEQLEEIKQQQADWAALALLLSPEHGLIAEQVNSYIGGFITITNQTINSIWSYPVEVKPCSVESGGLNYLFPVDMPTRSSSPDDISECSKGQKEVINFAFLLAVYRCLELDHLPLFTDELGSAFDEVHASKLMVFLNRLLDSGMIKQIFMVNHFQEMHGSLKNAEVLVLDEENVSAPVTANEHITFNKL